MKPIHVIGGDLGRFRFIEKAFEIGHEICEAGNGYLFHVHLKSGGVVDGVPEIPDGTNVLIMNNELSPLSVIPYDAIDYIDIVTV